MTTSDNPRASFQWPDLLAALSQRQDLTRDTAYWAMDSIMDGEVPDAVVAGDIARGRLVALQIEGWEPVEYRIFAVHRPEAPPGPAGRWFVERLASSQL